MRRPCADPQASLTISFGQDEGMLEDDKLTLYFSLLKDRPISELVLKSNGRPDLVASSILLSKADAELLSQMAYSATLLREKLAGIVTEYDYILIDCPPTLTLLTANAIAAAHSVLIPVKTDYLSVRGIPLILETIETLRVKANKDLEVLGVLPTLYNTRYSRDNEVLEHLRMVLDRRGIRVFDPIPRSVGFDKATSEGVPALVLLPNTPGVENYYKLADEIINHAT
jgi:chromosome partitioning protein